MLNKPILAIYNWVDVEPFLGVESLTDLFTSHSPTCKRIAPLLGGV